MPLLDVTAMNASLANDYGPTAGPQAESYHMLELWDGDPRFDGSAELTSVGGYAAVRVDPADWSIPTGGAIQCTKTFADATDAWSGPATHWLLRGGDTGAAWDADALTDPLVVAGAGLVTPITPVVYHADLNTEDDS